MTIEKQNCLHVYSGTYHVKVFLNAANTIKAELMRKSTLVKSDNKVYGGAATSVRVRFLSPPSFTSLDSIFVSEITLHTS